MYQGKFQLLFFHQKYLAMDIGSQCPTDVPSLLFRESEDHNHL